MPIMLNTVLRGAGFDPKSVRLLRHIDQRAERGRTLYELWRDNRSEFERYQALQRIDRRESLRSDYWASFLGTPRGETLFIGVYAVEYLGLLQEDRPMPHRDGVDKAESLDEYGLALQDPLRDLVGRLYIDWGSGTRAWVQYADRQNKAVTEIRASFADPPFPGFLRFMEPLSKIESLPPAWIEALRSCRGVYLLTCPTTKEQYVGSATGEECFWQRWLEYVRTGHGGNIALKDRAPSDYRVSILEVAGTAATREDILEMEARWIAKLQSREMGLNRNSPAK